MGVGIDLASAATVSRLPRSTLCRGLSLRCGGSSALGR